MSNPRIRRAVRRAAYAAVAILALVAAGSPRLFAEDQPPKDDDIKALAESVGTATEERDAWNDAVRLAGYRDKAGTFAVEAANAPDATPLGKIALGRVLLSIGQRARAAETLLKVAHSDVSPELRVEAMRLIGESGHDDAETDVRKILDESMDPRVRAAAAKTLWALTKDLDAKARLKELLRSEDLDSRVEGAVALAEIRDFNPDVKAVLAQIRDEPTPRGRLAHALLEKNEIEEMYAVSRSSQPATQTPAPPPGATDPRQALLLDVLRKVLDLYVDPAKLDVDKLFEGAAHGLVAAVGDPHTVYQSADEHDEWDDAINKEYGGIGAYVGFDQDGFFTVTRPMFGGPAWSTGLRPGDRILRIKNFEPPEEYDTFGQDLSQIIKHLRGTPNTKVAITVVRPGWKESRDMTLTRALIKVPTVYTSLLPGGVGFVTVDNFARNTPDEFVKAVEDLHAQGATSLVLDLRGNPGGLLFTAERLADYLLPSGTLVVETKGRKGVYEDESYLAGDFYRARGLKSPATEWSRTVPLAVLVNGFSASASEILSGSLQKNGRATIVGERTYGKGSVQQPYGVYVQPFAEPFTDVNHDGVWSPGDRYDDANGNGKWDPGERYVDDDRDGRYTPPEPYVDRNNNKQYDAPALKVTVAKYYVGKKPGAYEFNPHREEMIVAGRRVVLGGIEPDSPVAADELEGWRNEEIKNLEDKKLFDKYLDQHLETDRDRLVALANLDPRDPSQYPGFDEFVKSLDTKLSRDDVWFWLHLKLRERISNETGKFLVGDWVADTQLQRAIRALAETNPAAAAIKDASDYAWVFAKKFVVPPTYTAEALKSARPVKSE